MKIYPCFLLRIFILYYSLCMVWGRDLNSLFFMWTFTWQHITYWKACLFFFPVELYYTFIKSQLPINVNVYFQIYNLLYWSSLLFLCQDPLDYYSLLASFKIICMIFPNVFFFFKIALAILSPWHFHINFRTSFLISAKK